jgi:thiol-disulfide isomerase/thioredoxin
MKKYVAIIVMICLSMSLLMGCGGSGGGGQNADAQPKEEAQAETAQAEAQQQEEAQAETVQVEAKQQENTQAEKTEAASQAGMQSFMALTSQADGYVVFVKDANTDEPLARVKVQFCSDSQCMMALTDNTGAAVFNVAPGNYEAHILKPPAGYQKSSETANLTADDKVAVLKLLKEGEELKTTEAADGTDAAAKETAEEGAKEKSNEFRKTDAEWSFGMTGFTFKVPERYKEYKGQYHAADKGETDFNTNIFCSNLIWLPRTDEEREAIMTYYYGLPESEMETDEVRQKVDDYYKFNLATAMIVAIGNDMDIEPVLDELVGDRSMIKKLGELGTAGDYIYYYIIPDYSNYEEMFKEGMSEEFYAEYQDVMANVESDVRSGVTLNGPHRPFEVAPVGTKLSFETTDLQGNAVSSEDLFAGHKVTMINLWATWCTFCKQELPELEKLSKELAEKDCQIIGICTDLDDDNVHQAIKILEDNGVTYTNIRQTDEMAKTLLTVGLPTTYFVDSEGKILTTPVRGMDFAKYSERIEEALKAVE